MALMSLLLRMRAPFGARGCPVIGRRALELLARAQKSAGASHQSCQMLGKAQRRSRRGARELGRAQSRQLNGFAVPAINERGAVCSCGPRFSQGHPSREAARCPNGSLKRPVARYPIKRCEDRWLSASQPCVQHRTLAWTVIGLVSAVACSGSHEMSDAGSSQQADIESVDALAHMLGAEQCQRLFHCPLPIEDELKATFLWGDEAHCIAAQEKAIEAGLFHMSANGPLSELRRLEADGRIHIDPERVQACRAAKKGCWTFGPDEDDCQRLIEGDVGLRQPCELSVECKGDAYCAFEEGACPGRCEPRKSVGESCERWIECTSDGLVDCLWVEDELEAQCTAIESEEASGEGERCTLGGVSWVPCPAGLWCQVIEPDVYSGTCQQPIAAALTTCAKRERSVSGVQATCSAAKPSRLPHTSPSTRGVSL
jgi:hypothetical protein